jgi:hypothetical protein
MLLQPKDLKLYVETKFTISTNEKDNEREIFLKVSAFYYGHWKVYKISGICIQVYIKIKITRPYFILLFLLSLHCIA